MMITLPLAWFLWQATPDIPPGIEAAGPWAVVALLIVREVFGGSRKALAKALETLAAVERQISEARLTERDDRSGLRPMEQIGQLHRHLLKVDEDGNVTNRARLDLERIARSLDSYAAQQAQSTKLLTEVVVALRAAGEAQDARLDGLEDTLADMTQPLRAARQRKED